MKTSKAILNVLNRAQELIVLNADGEDISRVLQELNKALGHLGKVEPEIPVNAEAVNVYEREPKTKGSSK